MVSGEAYQGAPAWRLVIAPHPMAAEPGFAEGDFVGVTDFNRHVGAYTDGAKGLRLSDPDGTVTFEVELTGLSGLTNPYVSVDYFVTETTWETSDSVVISSVWSGGQDVAVDTQGSELDDYGWEGTWQTVTMDLSDAGDAASLRVALTSTVNQEMLYLDNIRLMAAP